MNNGISTQHRTYTVPGGFGDLLVVLIEVRNELELIRQSREHGSGDMNTIASAVNASNYALVCEIINAVNVGLNKVHDDMKAYVDGKFDLILQAINALPTSTIEVTEIQAELAQFRHVMAVLNQRTLPLLLQEQKVSHLDDTSVASENEVAISETPSETPKKAETNRAKLVRWVRANPGKAKTMGIRKIAKATGVNPATTGKFIKDYREGKITI